MVFWKYWKVRKSLLSTANFLKRLYTLFTLPISLKINPINIANCIYTFAICNVKICNTMPLLTESLNPYSTSSWKIIEQRSNQLQCFSEIWNMRINCQFKSIVLGIKFNCKKHDQKLKNCEIDNQLMYNQCY